MTTEENLIERLKALPVEKQRAVLLMMRQEDDNVFDDLSQRRRERDKFYSESQRLEAEVEELLAKRDKIRKKVKALLDAVATTDPNLAAELGSADSDSHIHEKPKTLLAYRGSIVVSGEQDFSAIRKTVVEEHAREEIS